MNENGFIEKNTVQQPVFAIIQSLLFYFTAANAVILVLLFAILLLKKIVC